ncbi:MAG: hypothetical protein CV087_20760 [Candidatus Brocadia sp. WS118]|nr:MAG: hypothetical protein CV087_20760 [Candidatus Brocadia sp. WS118]
MDANKLATIVALLVALSVASERLVEIIKGIVPFLNQENSNPKKEGWRRATIHVVTVLAGILTALLSRSAIPENVYKPSSGWSILALGLLTSGGSGFWNSVLTYFSKIKDIKKLDAEAKKKALGTGVN